MKEVFEYGQGLHYKLRILGITINGPACIYVDKQSVFMSTSVHEPMLNKNT